MSLTETLEQLSDVELATLMDILNNLKYKSQIDLVYFKSLNFKENWVSLDYLRNHVYTLITCEIRDRFLKKYLN